MHICFVYLNTIRVVLVSQIDVCPSDLCMHLHVFFCEYCLNYH